MASLLRRFVHSFLVIALLFPYISYGEGYIGEDLGTDLYRKIDAGQGGVSKALVGKRIVGSNARMNKAIQAECFKWPQEKPFLKPGQEFTTEDLSQIESGIYTPIFSRMNGEGNIDALQFSTDIMNCVQGVIANDFATIKGEVSREQKTLSRIGNTSIYTDGSLANSSYDLMKDLEQIHQVIFSKEILYEGTANMSSQSARNFISNSRSSSTANHGYGLSDTLTANLASSGWKLAQPASTGSGTAPKVPSISDACAADGNTIKWIDGNLIEDLQSQAYLGSNTESQGTGEPGLPEVTGTGSTGSGATGSIWVKPAKNNYNKGFKCTGFFCIDVDFVMYSTTLLGGGKSFSIQSVLEQNFKIVTEFAGSSFIQAKMPYNFFQLLLKDMNLPSMAHIGVVVTSLPAPILNLPGGKTPRGAPTQSDAEKEFDDMVSGVFTDYGLSVKRSNQLSAISNNEKDLAISNMEALTTDYAPQKLEPGTEYRKKYAEMKEAELKNDYADSFTSNLNQFEAFTKALVDHIGNLSSLIKKIDEIPQG